VGGTPQGQFVQIGFASDQAAGLQQAIDHSGIALRSGSEQCPRATTGGQIGGVDVVLDRHGYANQGSAIRLCTGGLVKDFGLLDQSLPISADPSIQMCQSVGLLQQGVNVLLVPQLSATDRFLSFNQ
jgi:hypothetical protein